MTPGSGLPPRDDVWKRLKRVFLVLQLCPVELVPARLRPVVGEPYTKIAAEGNVKPVVRAKRSDYG